MGHSVQTRLEALHRNAGSPELLAGFRSSVASTRFLKPALHELVTELDIRSLVDAGCGHANWVIDIAKTLDRYVGMDLVREVVRDNRQRSELFFRTADIIRDALPVTDAVLCRDCLGQLPLAEARLAVVNLIRSGARYLIATTYPTVVANQETTIGATRPLNLTLPPFDLPAPDRLICERPDDPSDADFAKSLGIWETAKLAHLSATPHQPPEAYCFIHVPKTSGTAFRIATERAFGAARIAYDYDDAPLTHSAVREHVHEHRDLPALGRALDEGNIVMLGGHVHFRRYRPLFPAERVITFLREPIARVVSEYHHFRRHNGFEGSLLEFAGRERNKNLQCSMLEGAPLDQIACFGLSERYDDSLRLFKKRLSWQLESLVLNVNPGRAQLSGDYELDDESRRQLLLWNQDDLALYEEACGRFDDILTAP